MKFTQKTINALEPTNSGQTFVWSDSNPAFGIRIGSRGCAYIAQTRLKGKTQRVTIGSVNTLTLKTAEKKANEWLVSMKNGVDPKQKAIDEAILAITLRGAYADFRATRDLKSSTLAVYDRLLIDDYSDWLDLPVVAITSTMALERHELLSKHSPSAANTSSRFVQSLLNFVLGRYEVGGEPIIAVNPYTKIARTKSWNKVARRTGVIKNSDLPAWFAAVNALESHTARDYLLFAILTGTRSEEARSLRWENVDLTERTFTLVETKNGKIVTLPLCDFLHAMLSERKKYSQDFVFSGSAALGYICPPKDAQRKIISATGIKFSIHDLRRTFISAGEALDLSNIALKSLANHAVNSVDMTARYSVMSIERLRAASDKITAHLLNFNHV